jgi:hypothetical protein
MDVVMRFVPATPGSEPDTTAEQFESLYKTMLDVISEAVNETCGVCVAPGAVGVIELKETVGACVSITYERLNPRLPDAPGLAKVNIALLPTASLMLPVPALRDVVAA